MSRNFGHRPIIELEPVSRDGSWTLRQPAPERPGRPPRRPLAALKVLLAAAAGIAAGAFGVGLFTISQPSWAQPSSWRRLAPGETAALLDAVVAGSESGLPLYSCRAAYADGMLVGRYRRDFGGCHLGYEGKEVEVAPFEVLSPTWADVAEGAAAGTLAGGEVVQGPAGKAYAARPVSPCRVSYQGAVHPGSWPVSDGACSFGFGGRTISSQNFSVLQSAPWMTWAAGVPLALPEGAVTGGQEGGEPFFVCRAQTSLGTVMGKVKNLSPGCSVPFEGREKVEGRFELLMPRWRVSSAGAVPVGAVVGGRAGADLQYLCRGRTRNTVQPGRVSEHQPGCRIGMQGAEVVVQEYEVLAQ